MDDKIEKVAMIVTGVWVQIQLGVGSHPSGIEGLARQLISSVRRNPLVRGVVVRRPVHRVDAEEQDVANRNKVMKHMLGK